MKTTPPLVTKLMAWKGRAFPHTKLSFGWDQNEAQIIHRNPDLARVGDAGAGAYLQWLRRKSQTELAR